MLNQNIMRTKKSKPVRHSQSDPDLRKRGFDVVGLGKAVRHTVKALYTRFMSPQVFETGKR